MKYEIIHKPIFSSLVIKLEAGERIKGESSSMMSMSSTIELKTTTTSKGIFGAIKSSLAGESFFSTIFEAKKGPGEVILVPSIPGDILSLNLNNITIFAQGGSYLASSPELNISAKGSLKAGLLGEGLFLAKISGSGILFLNSYGSIIEKELQAGETYIVDTGHLVAFEETVKYKIKKASKNIFTTLLSGEGLVGEFMGPGKIWLQTRNLRNFAGILKFYIGNK